MIDEIKLLNNKSQNTYYNKEKNNTKDRSLENIKCTKNSGWLFEYIFIRTKTQKLKDILLPFSKITPDKLAQTNKIQDQDSDIPSVFSSVY